LKQFELFFLVRSFIEALYVILFLLAIPDNAGDDSDGLSVAFENIRPWLGAERGKQRLSALRGWLRNRKCALL
jgi:hypothetical protein